LPIPPEANVRLKVEADITKRSKPVCSAKAALTRFGSVLRGAGRSVVVEYVDNRMEVVESAAVANHYLCEAKLNFGLIEGDRRYKYLCGQLDASGGVMDKRQLTGDCLRFPSADGRRPHGHRLDPRDGPGNHLRHLLLPSAF
jgi:hypothetical protein